MGRYNSHIARWQLSSPATPTHGGPINVLPITRHPQCTSIVVFGAIGPVFFMELFNFQLCFAFFLFSIFLYGFHHFFWFSLHFHGFTWLFSFFVFLFFFNFFSYFLPFFSLPYFSLLFSLYFSVSHLFVWSVGSNLSLFISFMFSFSFFLNMCTYQDQF